MGEVHSANTTVPFDAGSLRMIQSGDVLYIHTCHEMYTSIDSKRHQANLNFSINISTMTKHSADYMVSAYRSYVSHSFNQFVLADENGNARYLDHGDAYPRAVVLNGVNLLDIRGRCGDNRTGVSVGGFELSDTAYLAAGNSVDQSNDLTYDSASKRNLFVAVMDRSTRQTEIRWITNDSDKDSAVVSTPQLVKLNQNSFLLLWTEGDVLNYAFLDGNGNLTSQIYKVDKNCALSDCQPIVKDHHVIWYVTDGRKLRFFDIDLNQPSEVSYRDAVVAGDVNGDTYIDSADALMVLKIAANLITPEDVQKNAADVNGDGNINSADALLILKYAAGLIQELAKVQV